MAYQVGKNIDCAIIPRRNDGYGRSQIQNYKTTQISSRSGRSRSSEMITSVDKRQFKLDEIFETQ